MAVGKGLIQLDRVGPRADVIKWISFFALLLAAVATDWYYSNLALVLRISCWLIFLCALVPLVLSTQKGKSWREFARLAMVELRKVTWPSRSETMQTTMVVSMFVLLASMILWGMDALLASIVHYLSN